MALVLGDVPKSIKKTVVVSQPTNSIDGTVRKEFVVEIKKLPRSEFSALFNECMAKGGDLEVCQRMVVDITGIEDADGSAVEYNADLLEQLFEWDYISIPLVRAVVTVGNEGMGRALALKN